MPFQLQIIAVSLMFMSRALIHAQSTVTINYPLETITWSVPPNTLTETIDQETAADVISGYNSTSVKSAETYTVDLGREDTTQIFSQVTRVLAIPDITVVQSVNQVVLTRTIPPTASVQTLTSEADTFTVTSGGEPLDYYTMTGSTVGNSRVLTIIESFSTRKIIDIVPGPTVTHSIWQSTADPISFVESLGFTRITRTIEPTVSIKVVTEALPAET